MNLQNISITMPWTSTPSFFVLGSARGANWLPNPWQRRMYHFRRWCVSEE